MRAARRCAWRYSRLAPPSSNTSSIATTSARPRLSCRGPGAEHRGLQTVEVVMPCFDAPSPRLRPYRFNDLFELNSVDADKAFAPETKAQLVEAVAAAASESRSLRAIGSSWAMSRAAVARNFVLTDALNRHVSQPFPLGAGKLAPGRLRGGSGDFLARSLAGRRLAPDQCFVHVEAGVKVKDLLKDLNK